MVLIRTFFFLSFFILFLLFLHWQQARLSTENIEFSLEEKTGINSESKNNEILIEKRSLTITEIKIKIMLSIEKSKLTVKEL